VLEVQGRLEVRRHFDDEAGDGDPLGAGRPLRLSLRRLLGGGIAVLVADGPEAAGGVQVELLAELAEGGVLGPFALLEPARGGMPVAAPLGAAMEDEELIARAATDEDLDLFRSSQGQAAVSP
jgi:hypothetical protein